MIDCSFQQQIYAVVGTVPLLNVITSTQIDKQIEWERKNSAGLELTVTIYKYIHYIRKESEKWERIRRTNEWIDIRDTYLLFQQSHSLYSEFDICSWEEV